MKILFFLIDNVALPILFSYALVLKSRMCTLIFDLEFLVIETRAHRSNNISMVPLN